MYLQNDSYRISRHYPLQSRFNRLPNVHNKLSMIEVKNANNEFNKVTEIELDNTLSTKSEGMLNSPAKEWREAPEEIRAKCRAICNVTDTDENNAEVYTYTKPAIETAVDIAYQAGLTTHSAHLVARIEEILDRHCDWKPTEGYGSEEEKGYQKGLIAEARLLRKEILEDQAIDIVKATNK